MPCSLGIRALGRSLVLAPVVFAGLGSAALADAIDGDWCKAGEQFAISGPQITTPAGTVTTGTYDRHAFHWVDTDGSFEADADVYMRLLNDEMLRLSVGARGAGGEIWQRCDFVS